MHFLVDYDFERVHRYRAAWTRYLFWGKEEPTRSDWGEVMPATSSLLFAVTLDQGLLFYLGVIGLASWLSRHGRRELLWAAQLIAAYALWIMNYFLYISARVREPDEFYYYLLFVLSVSAGHGAYRVLAWLWEMTRSTASRQFRVAAVVSIIAGGFVPMTSAYWWNPAAMDAHFRNSLEPLPPLATELTGWILSETNPNDILFASGGEMQWVPALTGRQIMTLHGRWRDVARDVLTKGSSPDSSGVTPSYVVFHPGLAAALDLERNFPIEQPQLQQVFRVGHWIVYRITPGDQEAHAPSPRASSSSSTRRLLTTCPGGIPESGPSSKSSASGRAGNERELSTA